MIREARPEDAAEIARVHVDSWHETYTGLVPDEVLVMMTNYERRLNMWNRVIVDESQLSFVALDAGKVVAFVNGSKARDKLDGYDGELYCIYCLKIHHGKGIGRQLMQVFAKAMHENGFEAFYLWVLPNNPTRFFYEHMGGHRFKEKSFELAGVTLSEQAYGWPKIASLLAEEE